MDDDRVRSIVAVLEDACLQVEEELRHINADLHHVQECVQRYGDVFIAPVRYLTQLRENKLLRFREIIAQLEGLKTQIDCSEALLQSLNTSHPVALIATDASTISTRRR